MKHEPLTPLYRESDQIYGPNGSVNLPFALIKKIGQTETARLLWNPRTRKQAWIPFSVFAFHWHVVSAVDMTIFLIVPDMFVQTKRAFFGVK